MSLAADLELNDTRIEFVADYVLKTIRLKPDKWSKMYSLEENKQMIVDFFEKSDHMALLIQSSAAGALSVSWSWPTQMKSKACYFVKRNKEAIAKDATLRNVLMYGDLSAMPMEQLSAFVDEVRHNDKDKHLL